MVSEKRPTYPSILIPNSFKFNNQVKPFLEIFNPHLPIPRRLVHSHQTLEIHHKIEVNNEEYVSQAIIEQVLLNCFLSASEALVHIGHILLDIEKNRIHSLKTSPCLLIDNS